MQTPYIDKNGDLIVPNFADPKYQFWDESNPDRMTVAAILEGIGATDEVKAKYAEPAPVEPAEVITADNKPKRERGVG